MKIAMLSPFNPYRGGIAQFSDRLYAELSKHHEVKAFTFSTMYPNFLFPGKTQYVPDADLSNDENRVLSSINPFSYITTASKINAYQPDVLIIAYWMPFIAPAYGSVCLLLNKNIKVVALVHNAISHEQGLLDKPLAKFFFNRCDAFICMSDSVKADLQLLRKDADILVSPHPIYDHYGEPIDRVSACSKLGIDSAKKNILFFGLIRDYKGLDILIESMNYLDEDYQLIIAGESYGDFGKYQKLIDEYKLSNNIFVHERYIADDDVAVFFSAADILALPYRTATQSGVIAISYQMETPMVATDVGALGDTLRVADTGVVSSDVKAEKFAEAIKAIFHDQCKFNNYIANTRKEKQRLSWARFEEAVSVFLQR